MATDGVRVKCGSEVELVYQISNDAGVSEATVAIRRYDDAITFGLIQGDQELVIGRPQNLKVLARVMLDWAKAEEQK